MHSLALCRKSPATADYSPSGLRPFHGSQRALPVPIRQLWDAEHCPEDCLPWLAWALSVDAWDTYWPAHVKRQVILASANVHRHKGTVTALKQALGAFGVAIECQEWFETGEPAHTFTLHTPISEDSRRHIESQLNPRNYKTMTKAIDAIKPVRSHYLFKAQANWQSQVGVTDNLSGATVMLGQMRLIVTEKEQAA